MIDASLQSMMNVFQVEAAAQRKLSGPSFAEIAGGDRKAFERITFRPRMMIDTTKLDLTVELFGQRLFAPILVGPTSQQNRFHPEGELAMVRGASAAKTAIVVAGQSSHSIDRIAAASGNAVLWYQIHPEKDMNAVRERVQNALRHGCKAVCLTLGTESPAGWDWTAIDRFRKNLDVPLLLKGILSPEEARAAVGRGVQGIVVSNYRGRAVGGLAAPIEMLPVIADAISGQIPILIDGGFRRGTDVLKALALGARAVLLGRPPLWGLAAYGAEGVQFVLELLRGELARAMAMCGKVDLTQLDRGVLTIHRW